MMGFLAGAGCMLAIVVVVVWRVGDEVLEEEETRHEKLMNEMEHIRADICDLQAYVMRKWP